MRKGAATISTAAIVVTATVTAAPDQIGMLIVKDMGGETLVIAMSVIGLNGGGTTSSIHVIAQNGIK